MKLLARSVATLLLVFSSGAAFSQSVLSTRNLSLGGGGTAYLTGYEANFLNPANLMIRTRNTNFSFGIGDLGYFFNPVIPSGTAAGQIRYFRSYLDAYNPDTDPLQPAEIDEILRRNYKNNRLASEHQHRLDIVLAGIQWQQDDRSLSLTARARLATRIEVGRGWYDYVFIERNGTSVKTRDLRLIQQTQLLYEFSFGYAQRFDFITGLIPRLGELYIGIAPKFIIGGSYLDLNYDTRFTLEEGAAFPMMTQSLRYRSTGNFSEATQTYSVSGEAGPAIAGSFSSSTFQDNFRDYTRPTGYGAGIDFGLTYVLSLGSDLEPGLQQKRDVPEKSLRISWSITDIGFVSYSESTLAFDQGADTSLTQPPAQAERRFEGSPGQYIAFFDDTDNSINPLDDLAPGSADARDGFTEILPTTFNGGLLLELNRFKFLADLVLGLNDTAFNNTKLTAHFGIEANPFKPVPIRVGTRLAAGRPTLFSVGTGLVMKHWELSAGARFTTLSTPASSEFTGAAIGGLTFYF